MPSALPEETLRPQAVQEKVMNGKFVTLLSITFLTGLLGIRAQAQDASNETKVIEVSAKKYEFTPADIHVKKGTTVELKVHSVDETHGIKLAITPEGSKDGSTPGLLFDKPEDNGKVEKGQDQILKFVAQQAGTYDFKCAKVCGMHHGSMKGKLIVEE
jgi:cytochrome c oxidase subunit 2